MPLEIRLHKALVWLCPLGKPAALWPQPSCGPSRLMRPLASSHPTDFEVAVA